MESLRHFYYLKKWQKRISIFREENCFSVSATLIFFLTVRSIDLCLFPRNFSHFWLGKTQSSLAISHAFHSISFSRQTLVIGSARERYNHEPFTSIGLFSPQGKTRSSYWKLFAGKRLLLPSFILSLSRSQTIHFVPSKLESSQERVREKEKKKMWWKKAFQI